MADYISIYEGVLLFEDWGHDEIHPILTMLNKQKIDLFEELRNSSEFGHKVIFIANDEKLAVGEAVCMEGTEKYKGMFDIINTLDNEQFNLIGLLNKHLGHYVTIIIQIDQ